MKVIFCVHALILIVFVSYGQTSNNLNPQLVDPLPPSPNASALAKFGSIPVGPSTGIPQINIPIYQFSNKNSGLSLSVSLDYHAGGIRVDEVASNVGLGWALNAGGNISRVMKSVPDECADGFLNNPYFDGETGNNPINDPALKPFVKANNHQLDIEADIFSFNFNGRTGRFTYGRDGSILMIDDQKLKIEKEVPAVVAPAELMITKFVITDESGTKYTFDAVEKTYLPSASFHKTYASSWYLTKVLSPAGKDSILFQYDDVDILDYATSHSETSVEDLYPNNSKFPVGTINSASTQFQRLFAKRLKNIKLPNGINLQFVYNSALRTDLPNDNLLSKIIIQDSSKQKARGFILQQDYSLNQRATLLKVIPYSGFTTIVQEQPYQFFYNPGLPPRLSNQQDHWGYPTFHVLSSPNDVNRMIPYEIFSDPIGGRYEMPGINRDTDSSACAAGTLNKIIYPTGGRTEFELEPNQAYNGWLDKNFSVVVDDPPYQDQIQSYNFSMTNGYPTQQDNYFVFNGEPDGATQFTLSITPTTSRPWGAGTCYIRAEVFPTTGNTQAALSSVTFSDAFTQSTNTFSIANLVKGAQYKIRFYFTFSGASEYYGYAQLKWKEKQAATQHTEYYSHLQPFVGGLRVKRILDYDKLSTDPVSIRQYEYLAENGQSSGVLATYPTYTYTTYYKGEINIVISNGGATYTAEPPLILLRQSSSAHDIVYTNGSPVTYSRIVERIKSINGENGKIERLFTTNYPASGGSFPFVPPNNLTWVYGLLKSEMVYDANNNLIKKTENEYATKVYPNYGSIDSIKNFTSYSIAPVMFNIPGRDEFDENPTSVKVSNYPPIWFLYNDYLPLAGRSDLINTKVTTYDLQTHQSITESVSNEYDPQYFYLKKKTLLTSRNQQSSEIYTYPPDKVAAGQTEPYQEMVSRNMINPVIETEQQLNLVSLRKAITNYQRNWPNNAFPILPATIQSQYKNNLPEVRVRYYSYDNKGNPLSAGQENGTKICYVWAYNKQYLIAEIKNADYATVEAVLGGATAINNFCNQVSPTDAAIKNFLSPLRTDSRLGNALVITCTYEPLNGMTSQTDPSNRVTYYEYDGMGRLARIRDMDNNILKQYCYNYDGQTAPCNVPFCVNASATYSNAIPVTYSVVMTNTATGANYTFTINATSGSGTITGNQTNIPSGIYNITITPPKGTSRSATFTAGDITQQGTSFSAFNIAVECPNTLAITIH